jgi:hypothetical protein
LRPNALRLSQSDAPTAGRKAIKTRRDQPLHAQLAHVAERHRRASGVLGLHSITSSARSRIDVGNVMPKSYVLF